MFRTRRYVDRHCCRIGNHFFVDLMFAQLPLLMVLYLEIVNNNIIPQTFDHHLSAAVEAQSVLYVRIGGKYLCVIGFRTM